VVALSAGTATWAGDGGRGERWRSSTITGKAQLSLLTISDKWNSANGDVISDLIGIDTTTNCRELGYGDGALGFSSVNQSCDSSWSPYSDSLAAGDFTGDAKGDLIAVHKTNGCIYFWDDVVGSGTQLGCGWTPYVGTIAGAGDLNGDLKDDLVGINKNTGCLFRWYGTATGLGTGKQLGCGWGPYQGKLTGVGDLDSDGVADLVGVNSTNNCMYRWSGAGSGGLQRAVQLSCGWGQYIARGASGMGSTNSGDGHGDLYWLRNDGCLYVWLGNGNGTFGAGQQFSCFWSGYRFAA